MKELFKFDNDEENFLKNGGLDYSKVPFSLVSKYLDNFLEFGLNNKSVVSIFVHESKLLMPLLITLDGIQCSINLINTNMFNNLNSEKSIDYNYLITDDSNIKFYDKVFELIFLGKKIFIYKMTVVCKKSINQDKKEYIFYTSGTSGENSKVFKTNEILVNEAKGIIKTLNINKKDKILCIAPLFHSYGQAFGCFAAALAGSWVKYLPAFTLPTHIITELNKEKYTILITTPPYYERIYKELGQFDSLRYMLSAGGKLSKSVIESGLMINNVYGSTETGAMTIQRYENGGKCDCVGTEIHGVKITLGKKIEVNSGHLLRKLLVYTPYLAIKTEYENETIEFKDNLIKLKDIGYRDENGNLNIYGRIDNIININGEKISLVEVEEAFKKLEFIEEVKIIKKTDDNLLEYMVAYIVLNKVYDVTYIRKRCSKYLSRSKIPKIINLVSKLKKTETGKIMYLQEDIL